MRQTPGAAHKGVSLREVACGHLVCAPDEAANYSVGHPPTPSLRARLDARLPRRREPKNTTSRARAVFMVPRLRGGRAALSALIRNDRSNVLAASEGARFGDRTWRFEM
jgi:hypothetical protein